MRLAAATLRRLPRVGIAISPRARRRLLIGLVLVLTLFGVYRFWFRDSGFVRVQHVTVTGLTTKDAPRIRAALTAAARDMTTLDLQRDGLNGAVSGFPVVKGVVAEPQFPHGLKIHVIEERPAALLLVGGQRLLLAPDGSVLRGVVTGHPLPVIRSGGSVPQDSVTDGATLAALQVAAAAPPALADRVLGVARDKRGLVAHMRNGPDLVFGNGSRAAAKWAAVAAVLADPSSKGASYIDVRLPGRPVAGDVGAETLAPLTSTGTDASPQSNSQGTTGTTGPQGTITSNPQVSAGP